MGCSKSASWAHLCGWHGFDIDEGHGFSFVPETVLVRSQWTVFDRCDSSVWFAVADVLTVKIIVLDGCIAWDFTSVIPVFICGNGR